MRAAALDADCVQTSHLVLMYLVQICPYDCRHTLATLAAAVTSSGDAASQACGAEHGIGVADAAQQQWHSRGHPDRQHLDLCVYEEEPELLARHMLLMYVLLDGGNQPKERVEMFLELHGSALLRKRTADWLGEGAHIFQPFESWRRRKLARTSDVLV